MAKKKKKTHQKRPTVLKSIHYHDMKESSLSESEPVLMTPFLIYNRGEHDKKNIPTGALAKLQTSDPEMHLPMYGPAFLEAENQISEILNTASEKYMSMHADAKYLNMFDEQSEIYKNADILDFTQFDEPDILKNVMNTLASKNIDANDLSYLWSTNEYIRVIYSPSLEFAIRRTGYDENNQTVGYEIASYEHRLLYARKKVTMPSFIVKLVVSMKRADDIKFPADYNPQNNNLASLQWSHVQQMGNLIENKQMDYIYPIFTITDWTAPIDYANFLKKYARLNILEKNSNKKHQQVGKVIIELAPCIIGDLFSSYELAPDDNDDTIFDEAALPYFHQKISIAIACIIMTNLMLKSEKLSAPTKSTEASHIKYDVNTKTNDSDSARKTRNLGKIRITSHNRPSQPSMQKIIRFSKAEWSRQGFMRHYKNGKTVFVRPTTVKRRCVDVEQPQRKTQVTKYVIHSDKIKT